MASTLGRGGNRLRQTDWRHIGSSLVISIPLAVGATVLLTVVLQASSDWILPLSVVLFAAGLYRKGPSRRQLEFGLIILAIEIGLLPIAILLHVSFRGGLIPRNEVLLGGAELVLVVTVIAWPIGLVLIFLARRLGEREQE